MEPVSQDSPPECQICFQPYGARRRPKLLSCRHTCCSACLAQMRVGQKELRCPWCRAVTPLAPGLSVSQLPDDLGVATTAAGPHASEHTSAVFIRLPSRGCYMLPLRDAEDQGSRLLPGGQKGVAVVTVPDPPGPEEVSAGGSRKGSAWSGVCTVLLVACVLLFLLAIVLHNMSCISKRFTVISCG